jgi:hypothetical protein
VVVYKKKPIKIVDAPKYGALNNSGVVLNTPFCIIKTILKKEDIDKISYFQDEELISIFNPVISLKPNKPANKKM